MQRKERKFRVVGGAWFQRGRGQAMGEGQRQRDDALLRPAPGWCARESHGAGGDDGELKAMKEGREADGVAIGQAQQGAVRCRSKWSCIIPPSFAATSPSAMARDGAAGHKADAGAGGQSATRARHAAGSRSSPPYAPARLPTMAPMVSASRPEADARGHGLGKVALGGQKDAAKASGTASVARSAQGQ